MSYYKDIKKNMSKLYNQFLDFLINWMTDEPRSADQQPCDYNRLKHEIRPGDVLLIEGNSRVSKIIGSITQSPWTHAALYIGRIDEIDDPNLRQLIEQHVPKEKHSRYIIEGLLGKGTVISALSSYRYLHIRICRPIGLSSEDTELVVAYVIRALGKPYNVRQILDLARFLLPWTILPRRWGSSLFRTPSGEPEGGICSSLIAEAFTAVKFPILPFFKFEDEETGTPMTMIHRNPYLFTPKDFDYSPYFDIIKYPIMRKEQVPYYRQMPWSEEKILHQGQGEFITEKPEKKKKKHFFENFSSNHAETVKIDKLSDVGTKPQVKDEG